MQLSLVPKIACPRLMPSSAEHPVPGSRLLHPEIPSRKYAQRTRWHKFPPIEAMLRSCSGKRTDAHGAAVDFFDGCERKPIDVDQTIRTIYSDPYQIDFGRSAGEKGA
jgi:hypothetical protein